MNYRTVESYGPVGIIFLKPTILYGPLYVQMAAVNDSRFIYYPHLIVITRIRDLNPNDVR